MITLINVADSFILIALDKLGQNRSQITRKATC